MSRLKIFIIFLLIPSFLVLGYSISDAKRKNYYRTFEIISIDEKGLTLMDNDNNVIVVDKDPEGFKTGYKVRYDSVRNRLKNYRWQDYTVMDISREKITLHHKTGDTLFVTDSYSRQFKIGDAVRYDSVDGKVQLADNSSQWQQYSVVAASPNQIIIRNNVGQKITLQIDNNLYPDRRGAYVPKYKVGDLLRYDTKNNKLKKEVRRTYDWQEYKVQEVTKEKLTLVNNNNEKLVLENTYGTKFMRGDSVKYDRLNNLLKKRR